MASIRAFQRYIYIGPSGPHMADKYSSATCQVFARRLQFMQLYAIFYPSIPLIFFTFIFLHPDLRLPCRHVHHLRLIVGNNPCLRTDRGSPKNHPKALVISGNCQCRCHFRAPPSPDRRSSGLATTFDQNTLLEDIYRTHPRALPLSDIARIMMESLTLHNHHHTFCHKFAPVRRPLTSLIPPIDSSLWDLLILTIPTIFLDAVFSPR